MCMVNVDSVLLGRIAVCTAKAAYSRRPFLLMICWSVGRSVHLSSALWKDGGSDPDAIWHGKLDGSMDEAGSGVWGLVNGKE